MQSKFIRLTSKQIIKYVLLTGLLPIIILGWSGIVRTIDLAIYDFGFRLRSTEPIDERIILVEWTEENIQVTEESTISDNTLASLIVKIQTQQPRLVAFDLFRDIPVPSPKLTDEENDRAYDRLQNLFRTSTNLFGIEKAIEPKVNPPKELKEKRPSQVGTVDLPSDRDRLIRRGYTFPKVDKGGGPVGLPYLAVGLASRYLAEQGWKDDMRPNNSLLLYNQRKSIVINPLKTFAGAYSEERQDRYGLDFLINWRKGSKLFRRISVTEITSNQIPPDLFNDRLVIIGNVSSSTADRFILPLNRWRKTNEIGSYGVETFGVEVVAQVASSIISAALDGRPLMNPAPKLIEALLFVISVGAIIGFINKYRYQKQNLYLAILPWALSIAILLVSYSLIVHSFGWWLPVAWTIAVVWIIYFTTAYHLETVKKLEKASGLETFAFDLYHSIDNRLDSIRSSKELIQLYFKKIENSHNVEDLTFQKAKKVIDIATLNIEEEILRTETYKIQLAQFLKYSYLGTKETETLINVNNTIREIVRKFIDKNEVYPELNLLEQYDNKITFQTNISRAALEIILDNLLANAVFAIVAKAETKATEEYMPVVCIQTKLNNQKIQVTVKDNGVGIPLAVHEKIFLPFKSFRNDKKGTGLGLYIVKNIVNSHGKKIRVKSNVGEGAEFIFTLPVVVDRNHSRLFDNFLSLFRKK